MQTNSSQKPTASQSNNSNENQTPPTIDYWHVWVDQDGVSHQSRCKIQDFIQKSVAPPASPQWMNQLQEANAKVVFSVLPVGWTGTWHENPKPQWIIPLSGRWFVETMDGQRVEMGPGEISFGEDQGTKEDKQGHKGHYSGTVGNQPAVLMLVQLEQSPTTEQPCRFK
ncbi:MAG: cupin domain-containing protein [Scytonema sp. PMC 1069.18]|nr:cupin domain-containing protein [Scytonema sp. PMC 1069.18]MEC4884756.1 cupin domain-containing protein [Scytonema sp. PMC 1070.18]